MYCHFSWPEYLSKTLANRAAGYFLLTLLMKNFVSAYYVQQTMKREKCNEVENITTKKCATLRIRNMHIFYNWQVK